MPYDELVIPDDTRHWLLYANALRVNVATADFFDRKLRLTSVRAERE